MKQSTLSKKAQQAAKARELVTDPADPDYSEQKVKEALEEGFARLDTQGEIQIDQAVFEEAALPVGEELQLEGNKKIVSYSKNEQGQFVDAQGKEVDTEVIRQLYRQNTQGLFVDEGGQPVETIAVMIEEEPEGESSSEESEEESSYLSSDSFNGNDTARGWEEEADGIALNKILERLIRKNQGEDEEDLLSIENIWKYFLILFEEENFTKAFQILLKFGDDFYFLRGCLMAGGKIVRKLHKRMAQRVLNKLCKIRLAGSLDTISLHFIERGVRNNYLDSVDFETNNNTLQALEKIGCHFNHSVKDRAEYLKGLVNNLLAMN